jgi:hypothetical protein
MMRALLAAPPQAAQAGHPGQPCETLSGDRNKLTQLPGENKFRVLLVTSLRSGKLTEPENQKLMKESWT